MDSYLLFFVEIDLFVCLLPFTLALEPETVSQ